jgi:hypothetical protein
LAREDRTRLPAAPYIGFLALTLVGACSSFPTGAPASTTEVVVGVQSEPLSGAVGTLHVVTTLGALPNTDATISLSALPYKVALAPPGGNVGAAIAVRVEGYLDPEWTSKSAVAPILVRTAETHFVQGRTSLLRLTLQAQCLLGLPGGPLGAPSCPIPQTCIDGQCLDDSVATQSLEPYTPQWGANMQDVCQGQDAGPPLVEVGTGQSDYLPVTSGQTLQAEQGPQGGHHVWIAVRQENLKQRGSTTTLTSVQPATGLVGPRMSYAFTFQPDTGGFCKLFGLRYQLDIDGTDYHLFLGQPLDVTVAIKDPSGTTGAGIAHLNIDAQSICPSGVAGCPK